MFKAALDDFYYNGNPRLGEPLFLDEDYAVYKTSESVLSKRTGYLYANYQLRNYISFPLVICNHRFQSDEDDRERDYLTNRETRQCIKETFRCMDGDQAFSVLLCLKDYWNGRAKSKSAMSSKPFIEQLVYKISRDDAARFREQFESGYVADFSSDISSRRKKIAQLWFRSSEYRKRKRILHIFSTLGIPDMEEICERNGGFSVFRDPQPAEAERISILSDAAGRYFSDLYQYQSLPECMVICNESAPVLGLARLQKVISPSKNSHGLITKYEVKTVNLKRSVLQNGSFGEALSVYLHELLHQYGGDCSTQFHRALLLMNRRLLDCAGEFGPFSEKWKGISFRTGEQV